jgi:hypothetical protein
MCVPLTAGGYRVCISIPPEASTCSSGGGDTCCTSADCAMTNGGGCYSGTDLQFCGGAFPGFNQCVSNDCLKDADCGAKAICVLAGSFGLPKRVCLPAFCKTDADCTAKPGGGCTLIGSNPCCQLPSPDGLGCVYPGSCVSDIDCAGGACHLDPNTGASACGPASPGCPP